MFYFLELLKQLTERTAASRRVAEDDVVAIASFYAADTAEPIWTGDNGFKDRAQKVTEVIGKADDWGLNATDFDLPKIFGDSSGNGARATAELKKKNEDLAAARAHEAVDGVDRRTEEQEVEQRLAHQRPSSVLGTGRLQWGVLCATPQRRNQKSITNRRPGMTARSSPLNSFSTSWRLGVRCIHMLIERL